MDERSIDFAKTASIDKMDERSIDFAKTASIDMMALNNKVVNMRQFVKRAKVQMINKLCKNIRELKKKKGTEEQKQKNLIKAERFMEEIDSIKRLKEDKVSKYALANTSSFVEISKITVKAGPRALARLSGHPLMVKNVDEFRQHHPDWKDLSAFLLVKQTGRRFKTKKQKQKKKDKTRENVQASETMTKAFLQSKFGEEGLKKAEERFDRKRKRQKSHQALSDIKKNNEQKEATSDKDVKLDCKSKEEEDKENSTDADDADTKLLAINDLAKNVSDSEASEQVGSVSHNEKDESNEGSDMEENESKASDDESLENQKTKPVSHEENDERNEESENESNLSDNESLQKEESDDENDFSSAESEKEEMDEPVVCKQSKKSNKNVEVQSKTKMANYKQSESVVQQLNLELLGGDVVSSDNDDSDSSISGMNESNDTDEENENDSVSDASSDENGKTTSNVKKKQKKSVPTKTRTQGKLKRTEDELALVFQDEPVKSKFEGSGDMFFEGNVPLDSIDDRFRNIAEPEIRTQMHNNTDISYTNSQNRKFTSMFSNTWIEDDKRKFRPIRGSRGSRGGRGDFQRGGRGDFQRGGRGDFHRGGRGDFGIKRSFGGREDKGYGQSRGRGDFRGSQNSRFPSNRGMRESSSNSSSFEPNKGIKVQSESNEKLHPSWEASKRRREQSTIVAFQGKKKTFDDDD